ncbi:hypothetical protein [uncultured Megasphaera sp.]|jgi:hypothetical protein|uniref:hypothetical protein n=1 Tax=uncultured Megasphaera sp. TaxID=165188 RepID=UPI0025E9DDCD|nr:hypothetical protein [uncultured Megasphaera sp.]
MLEEMLPETMTATQAQSLLHRLLKRCKFEPSIAEVMDEWYAIIRENRRPEAFKAGPAQAVPQRHINQLKDTRQALLEGRPVEGTNLSKELIQFARGFFPEISLSLIEKNRLEISNCMTDRKKDRERKDGYMTYMNLDKNGVITLYMSKLR